MLLNLESAFKKRLKWYFALLLLVSSCIEFPDSSESLILGQIDRISINSQFDTLVQANRIQDIPIRIDLFDDSGNRLQYTNALNYNYYINDSIVSELQIDLKQIGNYSIHVQLPNFQEKSNLISIPVISLEEGVSEITLAEKSVSSGNKILTFDKKEEYDHILNYVTISILDIRGAFHELDISDTTAYIFLVDNKPFDPGLILDLPHGEYEFAIQIGDVISNSIRFFILDPDLLQVNLYLVSNSNNLFGLAGKSTYNFGVTFFDPLSNSYLNYNDFELIIDGVPTKNLTNHQFSTPGIKTIYCQAGISRSNIIELDIREDQVFPEKELPVIFHIVSNGDPIGTVDNKSKSDVDRLVDLTNKMLANAHKPNEFHGINSVNTHFKIYQAKKDPDGNNLSEAGINRITVQKDEYENFGTELTELLFSTMWDPNRYLNVFVMNVDGNFSWATYPRIFDENLEGIYTYPINSVSLTYFYGVMLNNRHFNSHILAHEIGHYLGLYHCWISSGFSSCFDSDYVSDTQDYINIPENVLNRTRLGCSNSSFISTNFMDYNISFYNSFTYDQRERMNTVYNHALFFPRGIPENGRTSIPEFRKGELDLSIRPVACEFY